MNTTESNYGSKDCDEWADENWFKLPFSEKLIFCNRAIMFPDLMNKNKSEFISKMLQVLFEKTDEMTDDQINDFLS